MKRVFWDMTDAEVRRHGYQTGFETLVVHAVTDEYSTGFKYVRLTLTHKILRLRTTIARLKLKGIDGELYQRWSMWFNLIYRVKSYQSLVNKISFEFNFLFIWERSKMS